MTTLTTSHPARAVSPGLHLDDLMPLSVDQYHAMIGAGILTPDDPVELLEGWLVWKMPQGPDHYTTCDDLRDLLTAMLPQGWHVRAHGPIVLEESEPEPDVAVVRGTRGDYRSRHPVAAETALMVEIAGSSLDRDRDLKRPIYARAGIPLYWIVNLVERTVEVHSDPSGPARKPEYARRTVFRPGDEIPVVLDGAEVGRVAVASLFPT